MTTKVVLLRTGNRFVVDPTTEHIKALLEPQLSFEEEVHLKGWARVQAKMDGAPVIEFKNWECFSYDVKGRLATSFGFWKKVTTTLKAAGYTVVLRDLRPHPHPEVYNPFWGRLKDYDIDLRHRQDEYLTKMFANPCGRFRCTTGFGKTKLIQTIGLLLPHAKIDIVSKRVAVICEMIYPQLLTMLPDVGCVGGGHKSFGHRVMCYTIGSAHYSPHDADILIGEECHELCSDEAVRQLVHWQKSRNYGLSASHERWDNKHLRGEGIFGPIIFDIPYDEAEAHGMVVPIEVHWTPVVMDSNPCDGKEDVEKKRLGIWRNIYRNGLIVEDARKYGPETQVMIPCETIDHAVHLKKLLPEFTLVYAANGMDFRDRRKYIDEGLIANDEPIMTWERKQALTEAYTSGELKKAICTTVWDVGVNFTQLEVICRANNAGGPVANTQLPGRESRPDENIGKRKAILHDYMDQFDPGFRRKALQRQHDYETHGWKQVFPPKPKRGSLEQRLLFDEDEPPRKKLHRPAR